MVRYSRSQSAFAMAMTTLRVTADTVENSPPEIWLSNVTFARKQIAVALDLLKQAETFAAQEAQEASHAATTNTR